MLNKIKTNILSLSACFLTVIAMSSANLFSIWMIYEPDIPQSLKKDL